MALKTKTKTKMIFITNISQCGVPTYWLKANPGEMSTPPR